MNGARAGGLDACESKVAISSSSGVRMAGDNGSGGSDIGRRIGSSNGAAVPGSVTVLVVVEVLVSVGKEEGVVREDGVVGSGSDMTDDKVAIVGTKDTKRCDVRAATATTRAMARTCGMLGRRTGSVNMSVEGCFDVVSNWSCSC